ncbi:hypothetical protein GKQ38_05235 [Candidatus Nanohaloarchaea archaeon]|nr:hypothetical protein GKQ38_05235 [Candidatus Nanohaloarchaea archaeon]
MSMIHTRHDKGLAEMIGFVVIFMIVVMMAIYFFSLNAIAGNSQSVSQDVDVAYSADNIRLRSSVTRLMIGKLWRSEDVNYGEYGDQKAYNVISKFLSSEPGEKIWLNGTSVDYSDAKTDIRSYLKTTMDSSYGNKPYRVTLRDTNGLVVSVGDVSSTNRVSYPIALQSGQGRITIYVEGGDTLYVR